MVESMQQMYMGNSGVKVDMASRALWDEFDAVSTPGDASLFMDRYGLLPDKEIAGVFYSIPEPDGGFPEETISDFVMAQEVTRLAARLREACENDSHDANLQALGIEVENLPTDFTIEDLTIHRATFRMRLPYIQGADAYKCYLTDRLKEGDGALVWSDGDDSLYLEWVSLNDGDITHKDRSAVQDALDLLFSIHLYEDVRTSTEAGISFQWARFGISAVWQSLSYAFTSSHVIRCRACGKPLVVSGERGNPRQFCDGACQRWANRHPDKLGTNRPTKDTLR